MTRNKMFELFRKVHIEEGNTEETIISERWRLMDPFKGMGRKGQKELEELMRKYVRKFK